MSYGIWHFRAVKPDINWIRANNKQNQPMLYWSNAPGHSLPCTIRIDFTVRYENPTLMCGDKGSWSIAQESWKMRKKYPTRHNLLLGIAQSIANEDSRAAKLFVLSSSCILAQQDHGFQAQQNRSHVRGKLWGPIPFLIYTTHQHYPSQLLYSTWWFSSICVVNFYRNRKCMNRIEVQLLQVRSRT